MISGEIYVCVYMLIQTPFCATINVNVFVSLCYHFIVANDFVCVVFVVVACYIVGRLFYR